MGADVSSVWERGDPAPGAYGEVFLTSVGVLYPLLWASLNWAAYSAIVIWCTSTWLWDLGFRSAWRCGAAAKDGEEEDDDDGRRTMREIWESNCRRRGGKVHCCALANRSLVLGVIVLASSLDSLRWALFLVPTVFHVAIGVDGLTTTVSIFVTLVEALCDVTWVFAVIQLIAFWIEMLTSMKTSNRRSVSTKSGTLLSVGAWVPFALFRIAATCVAPLSTGTSFVFGGLAVGVLICIAIISVISAARLVCKMRAMVARNARALSIKIKMRRLLRFMIVNVALFSLLIAAMLLRYVGSAATRAEPLEKPFAALSWRLLPDFFRLLLDFSLAWSNTSSSKRKTTRQKIAHQISRGTEVVKRTARRVSMMTFPGTPTATIAMDTTVEVALGATVAVDSNAAEAPAAASEDVERLRVAFDLFDEDGSGDIEASELQTLLFSLGVVLDKAETSTLLREIDTDGSGAIDFEEFRAAMSGALSLSALKQKGGSNGSSSPRRWLERQLLTAKLSSQLEAHVVAGDGDDDGTKQAEFADRSADALGALSTADARAAFDGADVDDSGEIDPNELQTLLYSLGLTLSAESLATLFANIDSDRSGTIDFDEFSTFLSSPDLTKAATEEHFVSNWASTWLLGAKLRSRLASRGLEKANLPAVETKNPAALPMKTEPVTHEQRRSAAASHFGLQLGGGGQSVFTVVT